MSINQEQILAFTDAAIKYFIFDKGIMPDPWKIFDYLDGYLKENNILLGLPIFRAYYQSKGDQSNLEKYNRNVKDLTFDLTIYYNELINQGARILDFFSSSEIQYRALLQNLKKLVFDFENLLNYESANYVVGDNFSDYSKVDLYITTAKVDTAAGKVIIGDGQSNKLDLSFYQNISEPSNLEFLMAYISRIKLPKNAFSNILTSANNIWTEIVLTESPAGYSIRFELPLTEDGDHVEINRIYMSLMSPKTTKVDVEYLQDGAWKRVFDENIEDINVISFIPITTNKLRFTLSKVEPDSNYGNKYFYHFGIKQIELYKFNAGQMAQFRSRPLNIDANEQEDIGIGEITLEVDENIPEGTSIEYYVAENPYLSGTFVLDSDHDVIVDDQYGEGSVFMVSDNGFTRWWEIKDSGVPILGELPSGEFRWIEIEPINRSGATKTKVNFDYLTEADNNEFSDGYILEIDRFAEIFNIGDLKLYKIYEWFDPIDAGKEVVPLKVNLYAGKNCWLFEEKFYEHTQYFETDGILEDGECIVHGSHKKRVLHNSIISVRSAGSLEEYEPIADYVVIYGTPEFGASIKSNVGNMIAEADETLPITYVYGVNFLTSRYIYKCYVHLSKNIYENVQEANAEIPSIRFVWWNTNIGKVKTISITNFNDDMVELAKHVEYEYEHDTVRIIQLSDIGQGYGIFKIEIEFDIPDEIVDAESDIARKILDEFNPILRITLPQYLETYAWNESLYQIGSDTLKYMTHKYDHTKFALYQESNGQYVLLTNNMGQFLGNTRLIFKNKLLDPQLGFLGIDPSEFFDISFKTVNKVCDSILFRAVLKSEIDTTPEFGLYKLIIRNE